MILVDTSVWIDHLRATDTLLTERLIAGQVLVHPFVIGELALGNLRQRLDVLDALQGMPYAEVASDAEVLHFIDQRQLAGLGIGYIDVHLLASTQLLAGSSLWTRDKRLLAAASKLGLAFTSNS